MKDQRGKKTFLISLCHPHGDRRARDCSAHPEPALDPLWWVGVLAGTGGVLVPLVWL